VANHKMAVKRVTITAGLGSFLIAQALHQSVPHQTVAPTQSEADMQNTTTNRRPGTLETVASAFLLLAGIIVMIGSGDAFATLIAAVVILTVVWGMIREIEHHVRSRAELAPVIHLRRALTGQPDLEKTSAHASWRGTTAAA
jgi:hypothetical protein